MGTLRSISCIGTAAYLLRWAETSQLLTLGKWSLTAQSVALGSSIITSTIGTFTGLADLEKNYTQLETLKDKRLKNKLESEKNLVLLKLAADVSICAWALLEVSVLALSAGISAQLRGGALALCCLLMVGSMAYEFHVTGGWARLQKRMDEIILPIKARFL